MTSLIIPSYSFDIFTNTRTPFLSISPSVRKVRFILTKPALLFSCEYLHCEKKYTSSRYISYNIFYLFYILI